MVLEKAWMVPRETWYQLAPREATVPAMAIQPRGFRLVPGLRHGSASMMRTPVRVRMISGRRARTLVDIYFLASVAGIMKTVSAVWTRSVPECGLASAEGRGSAGAGSWARTVPAV